MKTVQILVQWLSVNSQIDYAFSASTSVFFPQTKLENEEKNLFQICNMKLVVRKWLV